jgi:hypothetical protein
LPEGFRVGCCDQDGIDGNALIDVAHLGTTGQGPTGILVIPRPLSAPTVCVVHYRFWRR